ncbi:tRNA (adenosine(37)-N6)-threonylcarbamoyltransferase complex ATPase subunit type 1 TsaE [Furfurilactobacillus siliginis]|uniref:tRNA threonylcarbamoyladenosine biosynthesis protein TsaE n=1 Tax=Furfurilactobacillus siliginis TaxID=348151 RepID=A0A0R2L4P7_9LACO|nr:tRNA (adenosine(37)-N6)-threonylcarbamoyltransferase complex ATPase subunit type 1 TsaE [Furfurilactobacillus siliginis]KRN96654.1 ATP GTP hydrolase [Furfurilactobacillus siliginis]GEK28779.1 tRNA (adenosine(37)-N6)-threonylcarbamoyltransferase complex ATPase subunit type 1 TsaE [Furfurilactobacillus siliginis]
MKSITTIGAEETQALGQQLAAHLQAGDVILLDGDLGAGKTTFTKGLATGLGIKRPVKSPTFTIIREYQEGKLPLYHMDVYRLENGGGDELGLDEYFNGNGVSVVEWSPFVTDELPEARLVIHLTRDEADDDLRHFVFEAHGNRYEQLLNQLEADRHE